METVPSGARESVEAVDGVHLIQLAVGERMSVQHYRIEPGAVVPRHDHHHEQAGFVYGGTLTFVLQDGTEHEFGPGDSYALAGGEPHAVENRADEDGVGIDVFSPPRANPDWME